MEFRRDCERCHVELSDGGLAYLCASDTTYCATCFRRLRGVCAVCGGELTRRPRAGPARRSQGSLFPADPEVHVRRAERADLPNLVPLFDAYRRFYEQPSDPAGAERFLSERLDRRESVVFVAEARGVPVGFMQLYPIFSSTSLGRVYVLNDLFVASAARKKGVGGLLLETARAWGRNEGVHSLELSTAVDNPAQRLYEAHGWTPDIEFLHYDLTV